jgi:L-cysteine desulfidase
MKQEEINQIVALIKEQVIPAVGCTEPIAVALASAKMKEVLGEAPDKITVKLSANIIKNAMGVGIPGTGMVGLPIAVALGVLIGKSAYKLEVLKDASPQAVKEGKKMIERGAIDIQLKKNAISKLYVEVTGTKGEHKATVVIASVHTNFVYISKNEEVILNNLQLNLGKSNKEKFPLTMKKVYDFAMQAPLDQVHFIKESGEVNVNAAITSLQGEYGHALGKTLTSKIEQDVMGESTFSQILSYTSAACDARMAGALIPIISNSGSGNQGIAASIPVAVYAQRSKNSEEELIRALLLSHLTAIYIKQSLGSLSALCGCVVAATGSSCGITYLMGGDYEKITFAVKNMIANLAGMICDGAKPSCSLKICSGVSTAVLSAMMAMENKCVSCVEGIVDKDVDKTIHNLTYIGSKAMNETDEAILNIMVNK